MRGAKVKTLRSAARRITQGRPERGLKMMTDANGRPTGTIVNDPTSTRGVYRSMKKWVKKHGKKRPFTDEE